MTETRWVQTHRTALPDDGDIQSIYALSAGPATKDEGEPWVVSLEMTDSLSAEEYHDMLTPADARALALKLLAAAESAEARGERSISRIASMERQVAVAQEIARRALQQDTVIPKGKAGRDKAFALLESLLGSMTFLAYRLLDVTASSPADATGDLDHAIARARERRDAEIDVLLAAATMKSCCFMNAKGRWVIKGGVGGGEAMGQLCRAVTYLTTINERAVQEYEDGAVSEGR